LAIEFDNPIALTAGPLKYIIPFFTTSKGWVEKIEFSHEKILEEDFEWNYFAKLSLYSDKRTLPDYTVNLKHDFRIRYIIKKDGFKLNMSLEGDSPLNNQKRRGM
jgi:hypothetical protein